ncbi:MAG: hypothetical protein KY469_12715 [Actinobacteria bacterium]|nr:hypothetical protein [Actinomycetota bacterium]
MIKRLLLLIFGLGAGLVVGAIVMRRLDSAANAVKPTNLVRSGGRAAGSAAGSVRRFLENARVAAAEHEAELRAEYRVPTMRDIARGR